MDSLDSGTKSPSSGSSQQTPPQKSQSSLRVDIIQGEAKSAQFSMLLDQSFDVKAPGRFFDDFPVWDEAVGPGPEQALRIGVWEGDDLVSSAGIRLANLRTSGRDLKVALIGAVATAASHRGRGLASHTVSMGVEWARERGATMAILWGSEVQLYERLGFELCGMQVRAPLAQLDLGSAPEFSQITLGRGWIPSLLHCMRMRGTGVRLTQSDESWMEAHQNVDWYWLGDPEAPNAYAAVGRGIDLQGLVHEWGGDSPEDLKTLLQLVRMEHPDAQLLAAPHLLGAWQLGSPQADVEFLCMARALDAAKILEAHGIELPENHALLTTPNAAVCRAIFGPAEDAMPLWIWGLDAV